jgi:hypothetical protein
VTVLDVLAVLPQPSIIDQDLVCERLHPALVIAPSVCVTVGVLQASVAVALPNAAFNAAGVGLQPAFNVVPLAVIETVLSKVHVTVLETVDVLLHPSRAVNVLVCERLQPVLVIAPSVCVIVGDPQPSVAVAEPSAALIADKDGLHPNVVAPYVPMNKGDVRSNILVVAGDGQAVVLVVPAGIVPQSALVTYLVLIL